MRTAIDKGGSPPISGADRTAQSARLKVLLAAGAGAALGFQSWRLAGIVLAVPIPWYLSAWLFLGPALAGCGIGAWDRSQWWKRGPAFAAIFSLPSMLGAHALGAQWVAYVFAVMTFNLSAGLLTAFLADAVYRRRELPADARLAALARPGGSVARADAEAGGAPAVRQRLARSKAVLEQLDAERARCGNALFGRVAEDRIVWSELIELELQEVDERVSRSGQPPGSRPSGKPARGPGA